MKWLMFKNRFDWPPRAGATVHTGNLMRSLSRLGHQVDFLTPSKIHPAAEAWLAGIRCRQFEMAGGKSLGELALAGPLSFDSRWKKRLADYWGVSQNTLEQIHRISNSDDYDVVVAIGLETLPYLDFVSSNVRRVWYPADDPILHAASLIGANGIRASQIKSAFINLAYERSFRKSADRVWVVSERDRRWMERLGGFPEVSVIPNGVDSEYFQPACSEVEANTCIFWGRLDFPPNINAIDFFLTKVWQRLRTQAADPKFYVCGAFPTEEVRQRLAQTPGVLFIENPDDLRPMINRAAVAVMPMVSGAGVKNKLLEAAAMGKAIVATSRCLGGLNIDDCPPFQVCDQPDLWINSITNLWSNDTQSRESGLTARNWVIRRHGWLESAQLAIKSLGKVAASRNGPVPAPKLISNRSLTNTSRSHTS